MSRFGIRISCACSSDDEFGLRYSALCTTSRDRHANGLSASEQGRKRRIDDVVAGEMCGQDAWHCDGGNQQPPSRTGSTAHQLPDGDSAGTARTMNRFGADPTW